MKRASEAPFDFECLLVGTTSLSSKHERFLQDASSLFKWQWIKSPAGRALQMNTGAKYAKGDFLWFIHGDSRLDDFCLPALMSSVKENPCALHYFKLKFLSDGPFLVLFNALFANLRADIFKIPFGDQGLCLSRKLFFKLGGYDPHVRHEDHDFVWKVRSKGYSLKRVDAILRTSARKYRLKGWPCTTIMHLYMTYKYAIPRWLHLVRKKDR